MYTRAQPGAMPTPRRETTMLLRHMPWHTLSARASEDARPSRSRSPVGSTPPVSATIAGGMARQAVEYYCGRLPDAERDVLMR